MTGGELDPLIHAPARLRIVVTLAALDEGDQITFPRLQNMTGLTPGNLITHLRKLAEAGYVSLEKDDRRGAGTSLSLTYAGRAALEQYMATLRHLLEPVERSQSPARLDRPGPPRTRKDPRVRR